jgi:hypothetical protein
MTAPSTEWDSDIDAPLTVKLAIRLGLVDNIIASELKTVTACTVLKGYLHELWQPAVVRLFGGPGGAKTTDTSVFLNLRPQAIEVTSVDVKGGRILVKLAILGSAAVAGKRGNSSRLVLPDPCACRKLNPGILVMQSAQGWATKNVPGAIDGARDRCIFLQG